MKPGILRTIWQTPQPQPTGWVHLAIPTLVVLFILVVLAPFGFDELTLIDRGIVAGFICSITVISSHIHLLVARRLAPAALNPERWTVGRELLYNLYDFFLIGLWNTLLVWLLEEGAPPLGPLFLEMQWHTLLIGILPVLVMMGVLQVQVQREQLAKAEQLSHALQDTAQGTQVQLVTLTAENGKRELQLPADAILFLQAAGNYVEVCYEWEGQATKHLVRNRLKALTEELPESSFFTTHKSYVANLQRVARVEGNARDLRLHLRGTPEQIPVSRSNAQKLQARLAK
ncbi:MAG: LytTR family DNA-binding domain-containing protein [Bacteroidota bacterium]